MGSETTPRFSPFSTPSATREVLERHGLYTKYGLGQNFLVNDDVIRKIVELADVRPTDSILEVGPGIGTLTAALLPRAAHVTAIEKDRDLPAVLADTLAPWAGKFTLINEDALGVDLRRLFDAFEDSNEKHLPETRMADEEQLSDGARPDGRGRTTDGGRVADGGRLTEKRQAADGGQPAIGAPAPNKLVSNLPYAVAATIVLDYLQRFKQLESATVMVQKEVADRMTARPGTKTYGAYTVKLSLYAKPAGRFPVAPGNFFPPPHVESAVLRLDRAQVCDDDLARAACKMADAAFANRRKTLANSCKTYFSGDPETQAALPDIFATAGIDPRRRGETLTQEEFLALGRAICRQTSSGTR